MNVDLGDGQWADLAEMSELRKAHRNAVNRATRIDFDPKTSQPVVNAGMEDSRADALSVLLIKNWSLQLPLPSEDPDSLGKLTLAQADSLFKAVKPYLDLVDGKVQPGKPGTDPTTSSPS